MSDSPQAGAAPEGVPPSAENPEYLVYGEVAQEVSACLRAGRPPDPEALVARHPALAAQVRDLVSALLVLHQLHEGSPSAPASAGQSTGVPAQLGDYRLLREVGRGGMGVVYEAEQLSLNRKVALKMLPFAAALDARQLQRFKNEAQAAALLQHAHIVPVFAVGCEQGLHYYAMQFIEGCSLAALLRRLRQTTAPEAVSGPAAAPVEDPATAPYVPTPSDDEPMGTGLAPIAGRARDAEFFRTVARLGVEAAAALDHAHQQGVVHRDIKPANLLVDHRGHLWVADFGLARVHGDAGLTRTGDLVGALRYMSPEQASGQRVPVDHRTDVYSLGATLYELLTLRPVCDGTTRAEVVRQIAFEEPPAPRRLERAIPADLETIVLKTLSKSPGDRYATAGELAEDLRRFLKHKPILAKRPTLVERGWKWVRRHQAVAALAAALVLVALVGLSASTVLIYRAQQRTQQAYEGEAAGRRLARKAVDDMYTEVAQKLLSNQPHMELVQREFLEKALAYYEEFAREQSAVPELRHETGVAYLRVGAIRQRLGQHAQAEAAYDRAVTVLEGLAAEFPDEPGYRHDLAGCLNKQGSLFRQTSRFAQAEQSHRRALAVIEALVADSPGTARYRQELAGTHDDLGHLLRATTQFRAAEEHCRTGRDLRERLVTEFPHDAIYRHELAQSLHNWAVLLGMLDRPKEALAAMRQAQERHAQLAKEFPEVVIYREDLAKHHSHLAHILFAMGKVPDAEQPLREAARLRQKLVADFPRVPDYQQELANSLGLLGHVLEATRRRTEAEPVFRDACRLMERLVAAVPGVPDYRSELGAILNNLALVRLEVGDRAEARRCLEEAVRHQEAALAANPGNPNYLTFLGNHYANLADLLLQVGAHAEASRAATQMVQLTPPAAWRERVHASVVLGGCVRLADKDEKLGPAQRRAAAQAYAGQAVSSLLAAIRHSAADTRAWGELIQALVTEPDARLRAPRQALELAQQAAAKASSDGRTHHTLGVAHYRAGQWDAAIAALSKAQQLGSGDGTDDLVLAMAHWQRGDKVQAHRHYVLAARRLDHGKQDNAHMRAYRAETVSLLGLTPEAELIRSPRPAAN